MLRMRFLSCGFINKLRKRIRKRSGFLHLEINASPKIFLLQILASVKIIKLLCLPVVFRNAISIVLVLIRMTVKLQQQLNLFIIDVL